MKKVSKLSVLGIVLLFSSSILFAQTESKGDTLLVGPLNSQGVALGSLNEAIKGDTTANGDRAHSVYKLQRKAQYILTEVIQGDFPLVIVADPPDDANRPPIIRCGLTEEGSTVNRWWVLFDNATFINLWLSGINLDGNGPIDWISQEVNTTGKTISYDNCIVEFPYTWWATFADWGGMNVYKITNCIFQYIGNPTGATWNGAICNALHADSMIVKNTTFFDFGCFAIASGGNGNYYTEIDHCTFVNCVVHPIESHQHVQRKYTNNLFVNCHAFSDDQDEIKRHFDQEVKGLMNYAEIQWDPQALDSLYGPGGVYGKTYDPNGDGTLIPEETTWELKNNDWWYTQPIKDYWANWDNVVPNPWMNNYNKAMFNNKSGPWSWTVWTFVRDTNDVIIDSSQVTVNHEAFQFFVEENTMNEDPGIVDMNNCDALLAQNCDNIRTEWAGGTPTPVNFHNVSDYLAFTWPLDYDLSYTNVSLQTAGTDGLPVGSLQWWPDIASSVETDPGLTPEKFALDQNYPNPFNPTTTLSFHLPKAGHVTLDIFNLLGQKVAQVVDEKLSAGHHSYEFDASNLASGIYFYKINFANERFQSKKMVLLK